MMEKKLIVVFGDLLGDPAENSSDDRADINGVRSHVAYRLCEMLVEVPGKIVAVKAKPAPVQGQNSIHDGASGYTGETIELGKIVQLIEAPQRTKMKQHRAVASTGKAQRNTIKWLCWVVGLAMGDWQIRCGLWIAGHSSLRDVQSDG